jgi:hypothetical protein
MRDLYRRGNRSMDLPPDTPLTLPHGLGNHADPQQRGWLRSSERREGRTREVIKDLNPSYRNIHAPSNVHDVRFDRSDAAFSYSTIKHPAMQNHTEEQSPPHRVAS